MLNAQSRVLLEELDDAFLRAVDDDDVRVIILAGAGKHFSAGHDLGSPQEMADQKKTPLEPGFKGEYRRLWERFFENTMRWRDLPKPTIAQVQGYCIMGGMMIASACDLIIASDDAQFADRAVKWGGAHVQYFSMPWDFGPRKAKEYLFTGDFISAAEAERAGLVNRVVPRAKLEEETMALAQHIAERDPYALKLAKASVNEMQDAQGFGARRWRTPSRTTCSPSRIASRWAPTALRPAKRPRRTDSRCSTRRRHSLPDRMASGAGLMIVKAGQTALALAPGRKLSSAPLPFGHLDAHRLDDGGRLRCFWW